MNHSTEITSLKPLPIRLLVVDDDPAIREVASAMLVEEGYEILTAEDGLQALELLQRFNPDLVITDLQMPRMSGFELVKIMHERFPQLPVIVISGEFGEYDRPPEVTAAAFFSKSGSFTTLGAKVLELLSGGRPPDPIAAD